MRAIGFKSAKRLEHVVIVTLLSCSIDKEGSFGGRKMNRWSAQSALPSALLVATIFMGASPARADVMEVGPEGARWVTGDLAQKTATIAAVNDTNDVAISGLVLPAKVVANVSRNAAGVPAQYAEKIAELSRRFDLSPSLLEALVWQESRWRERAVSMLARAV